MPIYIYVCIECDKSTEITRGFSDTEIVPACEKCGYRMIRSYSLAGVHFKGSGFYSTDKGKR